MRVWEDKLACAMGGRCFAVVVGKMYWMRIDVTKLRTEVE